MMTPPVRSKKYTAEEIFSISKEKWALQREIDQATDKLDDNQDAMTREDIQQAKMHIAELRKRNKDLRKLMQQAIREKQSEATLKPAAKKETSDDPNRTESDSDHEQQMEEPASVTTNPNLVEK